jgi:hypothetical protein
MPCKSDTEASGDEETKSGKGVTADKKAKVGYRGMPIKSGDKTSSESEEDPEEFNKYRAALRAKAL